MKVKLLVARLEALRFNNPDAGLPRPGCSL